MLSLRRGCGNETLFDQWMRDTKRGRWGQGRTVEQEADVEKIRHVSAGRHAGRLGQPYGSGRARTVGRQGLKDAAAPAGHAWHPHRIRRLVPCQRATRHAMPLMPEVGGAGAG
jgi:hypothetical protein